ncbi:MAG: hypothetical protein QF464_18415, partial [Myxococcota bacterium]|nr:hypothetical protein [Myxococcota bacterium]
DGVTLEAYLAAGHEADSALALTLYVTGEICRALAYLASLTAPDGSPQPIAHGNLVPSSILLGRQGVVMLTNFQVGTGAGSDPDTDLGALSRLCHWMLLGREPSEEEEASLSGVPPGLAATLRRAKGGLLDADALHDGLLDYSFDAAVRVSDRALINALHAHDGVDDVPVQTPTTRPLGTPRPRSGESSYRVQSGTGSRLGTIPKSNFESLLVSDAIEPTAMVSVDGGPWQPLEGLPIYGEIQQGAPEMARPARAEALDAERLPTLGAAIGIERLTGCLRAQHGQALKQFWFRRGVPIHSTSTRQDELLGPCMVRAGLIDHAALETAQATIQTEGGLFGEVLLRHGLCSAGALHRGLEMQLQQRFYELLEWPDGQLEFVDGDTPRGEVMRMSYDAAQLVTTMVRGFYDEARLFDLLQPHLDARIGLVDDGPITHANLRLNGRELRQHGELTEGLSLREHLASLSASDR